MRLIKCSTLQIEEFFGSDIPPYAILSHTWGEGEVSFVDMKNDPAKSRLKEGYRKIDFTCRQALLDGLQYAWVDTCCIDKSSSAELSEAINSMFRWYEGSRVCYVYLADVTTADFERQFSKSRWFTRGWTLQELLAPEQVTFYDCKWIQLGTKIDHADWLHQITNIDQEALVQNGYLTSDARALDKFCTAQKMSWASSRQTTREEDIAYSLLGVFDVTMPLLYGEGMGAFKRLQETIIRQSGDDTILAWNLDTASIGAQAWHATESSPYKYTTSVPTYLAESPRAFANCGRLRHAPRHQVKMEVTNIGLQIEVPLVEFQVNMSHETKSSIQLAQFGANEYHDGNIWLALLSCVLDGSTRFVGIMLSDLEKTAPTDRLFFPLAIEQGLIHAITVDAHLVAEASSQTITIVPSSFLQQSSILASGAFTHILMFPSKIFVSSGLCVSDAKCFYMYSKLKFLTDGYEIGAIWTSARNELIVKTTTFEERFGHNNYILLWITHSSDPSNPLYRIQLCAKCGVYAVDRWHKDLKEENNLSQESHMVSDQMSFPTSGCIFKVKITKKDICQRRFILVDLDLGNLPWEYAKRDPDDDDGEELKRSMW